MQLTERFGTGTTTQAADNGKTGAAREELQWSRPRKTPAFLSSLPQASSEYVSVSKVRGPVRLWPQPKSEQRLSLCGFQPRHRRWTCPRRCRDLQAAPGRAQVPPRDSSSLPVSSETSSLSSSDNKQAHTKPCLSTNQAEVEDV